MIIDQHSDDHGKANHEHGKKSVFLLEKGHGPFGNRAVDIPQALRVLAFQSHIKGYGLDLVHVKEGDPQAKQPENRS